MAVVAVPACGQAESAGEGVASTTTSISATTARLDHLGSEHLGSGHGTSPDGTAHDQFPTDDGAGPCDDTASAPDSASAHDSAQG
ncbi:MAG: hypothetical protein IPH38_12950 [Candidatus Microthrix sp.]|nr:hypothetical protein [Candidatus Microthrix sp.]MBK7020467.1 hypothetical protein [Candidatus Microthrix sp.]